MRHLVFAWIFVGSALALPAATGQAVPAASRDLKTLEARAQSDSGDAEAQFDLALAYWKKHRWRQVDSLLRLAIQLDPRFAEAYLALYCLPFAQHPSLFEDDLRGPVPKALRQ